MVGKKRKSRLKVSPGGKGIKRTRKDEKAVIPVLKKISVLTNSYKYLLEHVLVLRYIGNRFRLLVIHEGKVFSDRYYKSFKGAQIAYARLYNDRKWNEETEPEWSEFYNPVKYYLDLRDNRIVGEKEDRKVVSRGRRKKAWAQSIM